MAKDAAAKERAKLERAAYARTHKDSRATYDGVRCVLRCTLKGTMLVALRDLSDAELREIAGVKEGA